jgi:tetratricopeptide (TPR) repeat protein
MPKWLKKITGGQPPPPVRPSEVPVDERALELVAVGDKMFAVGDYDGAQDAYNSALTVDGHCALAWQRRGRAFAHDGKTMEALACQVRSLELDSHQARAWLGLGEAILSFIKEDKEPLFIRENRPEVLGEAIDCFSRALKLEAELVPAREGLDACRAMMGHTPPKLVSPRHFSFHSGGILEKAKREAVSPFLKPGDYRRQAPPPIAND